jgi:hypothetical protein
MRAWVSVRAGAVPPPTRVRSRARSASLNTTTYFFAIVALPRHPAAHAATTARIQRRRSPFKWRLTRH